MVYLFFFYVFTGTSPVSPFLQRFAPLAKTFEEQYNVPASVQLGIAAVESGWGTSIGAKNYNAYFGMGGNYKGQSWTSQDGQSRAYFTAWESWKDFINHLTKSPYYQNCHGPSIEEWVWCISRSYVGPNSPEHIKNAYFNKVMGVITRENLYRFDSKNN